jgi:hypothetical protein
VKWSLALLACLIALALIVVALQLPTGTTRTITADGPGWQPSSSPDNRIGTSVALQETVVKMLEPTPKNTRHPTQPPTPTIPACDHAEGVTACRQGTATPTSTPRPARTAVPALGPCGTPQSNGWLPELCLNGV